MRPPTCGHARPRFYLSQVSTLGAFVAVDDAVLLTTDSSKPMILCCGKCRVVAERFHDALLSMYAVLFACDPSGAE